MQKYSKLHITIISLLLLAGSMCVAATAAQHPGMLRVESGLSSPSPGSRALPDGTGPHLAELPRPVQTTDPAKSLAGPSSETFIDLPCNLFLPGKADPREWMSTSTVVRVTYDGYNYQYGYDPFAQTYDVAVSGLADFSGILVQETVGIMAAQLPAEITAKNVRRIEAWFVVSEHNLYPFERIAITSLEEGIPPNSSLNTFEAQLLYEDARGFSGNLYFLDHLAARAHAIDLGDQAVTDLRTQIELGWFGVGFSADGWDLSGSLGQTIFWTVAGGGSVNNNLQPFFRIYYNAPPDPFELVSPADGVTLATDSPAFAWESAWDPNGDTPITYRLRLGTDPDLETAFELDAGSATNITPPFSLSPDTYYWEVIAIDPDGEFRRSARRHLMLARSTDAAIAPHGFQLDAYPNPFNPITTIRFSLPEASPVSLEVFNLRGLRVRTLLNGQAQDAGSHRIVWDGKNAHDQPLPAGIYFYRIDTGDHIETRKITLAK